MLSPRSTISKLPQESPEYTTPAAFREIFFFTWGSSLCLQSCDKHKEATGLFMSLWVILETSIPVLTREKDNQN